VGVAAKFAEIYSRCYESPKEFLYIDILGIIGTLVSGRFRADFDLPCQPRLYVLKVAQSAWNRKSTSSRMAQKFICSSLQAVADSYVDYESPMILGAGSAEGLATRLIHRTTVGGVGETVTTRRAVLLIDEFRRFEAKSHIEGSALRPMVNELYESNQYESLTKSTSIRITDGHLGFLSNTTEEAFKSLIDGKESEDLGLFNRFFLLPGRSSKRIARPKAPPESELAPLRKELQDLFSDLPPLRADGSGDEVVIPLTPGAISMWEDWYVNLEETPETARLDNLGMRLMGLLAFVGRTREIDEELMSAVLDILEYQKQVRSIYQTITGENPAARMEQKIRLVLRQRGALLDRDLSRYTNAHRSGMDVYRKAKASLMAVGEMVWRPETKMFELVQFSQES
jgi:hypothetical protein